MGKKGKGVAPNLLQKRHISAAGLDWKDWLVVGESAEELKIASKATGNIRTLKKTAPASKITKRSK